MGARETSLMSVKPRRLAGCPPLPLLPRLLHQNSQFRFRFYLCPAIGAAVAASRRPPFDPFTSAEAPQSLPQPFPLRSARTGSDHVGHQTTATRFLARTPRTVPFRAAKARPPISPKVGLGLLSSRASWISQLSAQQDQAGESWGAQPIALQLSAGSGRGVPTALARNDDLRAR